MLNTGIFPNQLNIYKVIPFYKANDESHETLLSNYRPIALLPSVFKIFENAMLNVDQILNYFINSNILSMQQYGFKLNTLLNSQHYIW